MTDKCKPNETSTDAVTAESTRTDVQHQSDADLHRKYLEQQSRMRCVGCGEGEEYF